MIFVTVGSYGFDELVQKIDEISKYLSVEIEIQIANSTYEPKNIKFFRTAPSLNPHYDKADIVVAHGGTGTTIEVLSRGIPLISVPNKSLKDDHQSEFLTALEKDGAVTVCSKLDDLLDCINQALSKDKNSFDKEVFFQEIAVAINQFPPENNWLLIFFHRALRLLATILPPWRLRDSKVARTKYPLANN